MWQNIVECGNVAEYGRIWQNAVMSFFFFFFGVGASLRDI